MIKCFGSLLSLLVCSFIAQAIDNNAKMSRDSLEFVYPLLVGAGVRYEHLLSDHFALDARSTAGMEFYVLSASGDAGLTYYIDGPFNGFYGQVGAGCLYAFFPGGGSDEDDTKKGPMLAFDLGWKSSDSGFYVRSDIGVKLSSDAVIPTLEFGFGGNLGGPSQSVPASQTSKNINSVEIGLNAMTLMIPDLYVDYEHSIFPHLAAYTGLMSSTEFGGIRLGADGYFFKPFDRLYLRLGGTYAIDLNESNKYLVLSEGSLGYKAPLGNSWFFRIGVGGDYPSSKNIEDFDQSIHYHLNVGVGVDW